MTGGVFPPQQPLGRLLRIVWAALLLALPIGISMGCATGGTGGGGGGSADPNSNGDNGNDNGAVEDGFSWTEAFDASETGALSAMWGSSPDNAYVVGGVPELGEVYHFDGTDWTKEQIPQVRNLIWVYGFAPDDIWAVGEQGGAIHYDGDSWEPVSTPTQRNLYGIWGAAPDDLWAVGGEEDGQPPELLHWDGTEWSADEFPEVSRSQVSSLFKVWGTAADNVFAVGDNGVIIHFDGSQWEEMSSGGASDDLVSLWGTGPDNIVAVGGRSVGIIAHFDGTAWTTQQLELGGLNGVYMIEPDQAVFGGINGAVGTFNPETDEVDLESSGATDTVHGIWGDGAGQFYAVGGRFSEPYRGLALVRVPGVPNDEMPEPPAPADATVVIGETDPEGGSFNPIVDGQSVVLFEGPQGGIHIEITLRATGLESTVTLVTDVDWEAGGLVLHHATRPDLEMTILEDGTTERQGFLVILDEQVADREQLFGELVRLTVTLSDESGEESSQSVVVELVRAETS